MDDDPLIRHTLIALLSLFLVCATVGTETTAQKMPEVEPTPVATYTPTPGRWKRYLPCDKSYLDIYRELPYLDEAEAESYVFVLAERARWWATWIEYYRDKGTHKIPMEIGLAILMRESRGDPSVVSCSNAIGLMGIVPSDSILKRPTGCENSIPLTFPGHPPTSELLKSRLNIKFGLDHLEFFTWEGQAYIDGLDTAPYRPMLYDALPEAANIDWWYSDAGRSTIAMYQCGSSGLRSGNCGKYGGSMYADDVLGCWVPWVVDIMGTEEPSQNLQTNEVE